MDWLHHLDDRLFFDLAAAGWAGVAVALAGWVVLRRPLMALTDRLRWAPVTEVAFGQAPGSLGSPAPEDAAA